MTLLDQRERIAAGKDLVEFLSKYTELLELQLAAVRTTMQETVNKVMDGINEISKTTESKKAEANSSEPDPSGKFSRHIEALKTLDAEVKGLLLSMMGALSNDDVVGQRLEHISTAIHALKVGLSYVLVDFDKRFNRTGVESFKSDLIDITCANYTMEEERNLFNNVIGQRLPAKKSS